MTSKKLSFKDRLDKFLDIVISKEFEEKRTLERFSALPEPQGLCDKGKICFQYLIKHPREDAGKFLFHYPGCPECLSAFRLYLKTIFP